jgi:hypothetical protein
LQRRSRCSPMLALTFDPRGTFEPLDSQGISSLKTVLLDA